MSMSRPSPVRPLLVGGLIGLLVGLGLGLYWAWIISPATYAGGALPSELTEADQAYYVKAATDEYLKTNDIELVRSRLSTFSTEQKVRNLALAASSYQQAGQVVEGQQVARLAAALKAQENWEVAAITAGLGQASARPGVNQVAITEVASQLGLVQPPPGFAIPSAPAGQPAEGRGLSPLLLVCLILVVTVLAGAILAFLLRQRGERKEELALLAEEWDGVGPPPFSQWTGAFKLGQDHYDESFTIDPAGEDLGECGMGILEYAPGSSPKEVRAFDVWLFDKLELRTTTKVLFSEEAFNDPAKRERIIEEASSRSDIRQISSQTGTASDVSWLIPAQLGTTFDIETPKLVLKATVDEISVAPEGYFNSLKVRLSTFLKPEVDLSPEM